MDNKTIFQINLDQIIRSKVGNTTRKIPRFVTKFLSRLIKEDDLNNFLRFNGNSTGVETMDKAVEYFKIKLELSGEENIPTTGEKFIFASNHPLGGLDGICLSSVLGTIFDGKINYLVNDLLYFIEPLKPIFVPVNKHGSQAKSGVQAINNAFSSDNQIITFPAGLCSRKQQGRIVDSEWKKMFVAKAIEYKRTIIPVYFDAGNSNFFYNLANIRKVLKIKFNLEMLLLSREMFKSKGKTFRIYFGKPVSWEAFDNSKSLQDWANWMKEQVYLLK
ncbi:MAG: 1-acyl-sn-glycerol-3-phosphate acyltransferase [Dysgonamonadaceae bacterium]|jgi:putative hemolysin|nr:1-acyl-sn-glycerol-3-phosphate acyltransferase [Dysgonamonadaceae bacterium]